MKKLILAIFTIVIILTISINISAATFSDVLITYLVDQEFGTVISSSNVSLAINESQSGESGGLIFTIPKVVEFTGDDGVFYRSPIVDESFGLNTIKFQSGSNVEYSGSIINGGATYVNTLESGDNYIVTFTCSPWDLTNIYYKLWTQLESLEGFIYVEVTVNTEESTDDKIFEYLMGSYNSPEISKGNEDIAGALDAINPLETGLAEAGENLDGALGNVMNNVKRNINTFKTPIGKAVLILGSSINPLFEDGVLFFLVMVSVVAIVILAVLRKAGD